MGLYGLAGKERPERSDFEVGVETSTLNCCDRIPLRRFRLRHPDVR
jgi:hypothetical protein